MSDRTYRALLIANSVFPADSHNLLALEGPRSDPAVLREALCDERIGLFNPDNIRLVNERAESEIRVEIDELFSAPRIETLSSCIIAVTGY